MDQNITLPSCGRGKTTPFREHLTWTLLTLYVTVLSVFSEGIMNTFIHQNGRVADRDNLYNRLKTDTSNTVGFKGIKNTQFIAKFLYTEQRNI